MNKQLELEDIFGNPLTVELEIQCYANNGCMYIGLIEIGGDYPEHYGDMTVNLDGKCPDYCGYVDTNHMPQVEEFIRKNELGEFTGLTKQSGFCTYPLYMFNVDKLREMCPEGMEYYEQSIGSDKRKEQKERVR